MNEETNSRGHEDWLLAGSALVAAENIRMLRDTARCYARSIDPIEMSEILALLQTSIRGTLARLGWTDLLDALPDVITPTECADCGVQQIVERALRLHCQEVESHQGPPSRLSDPALLAAVERLGNVMFSVCLQPDPDADPCFRMPARHAFMLREYWNLLSGVLAATGEGEVGWAPHPLTSLVVNLEARICACLDAISDEQSASMRAQITGLVECALDPQEFSISWECGDQAEAARVTAAIERVCLRFPSAGFDLTSAECMYLEQGKTATSQYQDRVRAEWNRISRRLEAETPPESGGSPDVRDDVWGYVRQVELSLRKLVFTAYSERFGEAWLYEVKKAIGEEDVADTLARLAKDKAKECDFLHFLQPRVLRELCTHDWNLTGHFFPGRRRKDINALLEEWLRARTPEAHNRPVHLWSKIERHRARVTCHDLLQTMSDPVRVDTGD